MYWTEEAIKKRLDGTVTFVNVATSHIETRRVALDHIPTHKGSFQSDYAGLSNAMRLAKANPWLPEEDERLLAMRERGVKWESIRKIMQRGEKAVKERYLRLCRERGIEPLLTPPAQAPMLTNEAKAQIIVLRKQGLSPAQVAEMTGRPAYQVADYYTRYLASKRLPEVV